MCSYLLLTYPSLYKLDVLRSYFTWVYPKIVIEKYNVISVFFIKIDKDGNICWLFRQETHGNKNKTFEIMSGTTLISALLITRNIYPQTYVQSCVYKYIFIVLAFGCKELSHVFSVLIHLLISKQPITVFLFNVKSWQLYLHFTGTKMRLILSWLVCFRRSCFHQRRGNILRFF